MQCTCPHCGTTFEAKRPKAAPRKPAALKPGQLIDRRKPWQKNSKDHKWNEPIARCGCMLQSSERKFKTACRNQRVDTREELTIYAETLGIPIQLAKARVIAQESTIRRSAQ